MILQRLLLQSFRSYSHADFTFDKGTTFVVGPNTAGKSNLIEAIYLLSSGKSFRAEKDEQMVHFHDGIGRIKGKIIDPQTNESNTLEVVLAETSVTGKNKFIKKFLMNDVPKRRADFAGTLHVLLFDPTDLETISGSPSLRREFLDEVLEQTDTEYRHALLTYTKALRHRNALLQHVQETGIRNERLFSYWDELIITNGQQIHEKRAAFITWMNEQQKHLFQLMVHYDHSIISEERLAQYKDAEAAAGLTLVGPHRDDIYLTMQANSESIAIKSYGSRGQQRLAVVQLKLLQLLYMQGILTDKPLLLLDDIFSELDEGHIRHVLQVIEHQQTIITTTHEEFLSEANIHNPYMIQLTHSTSSE